MTILKPVLWFSILSLISVAIAYSIKAATPLEMVLTQRGLPHAGAKSWIKEDNASITILRGYGGFMDDWQDLADYAVDNNKQVRILRSCLSACTLLAERIRAKDASLVCVSRKAVFGMHQSQSTGHDGAGISGTSKSVEEYYGQDFVAEVAKNSLVKKLGGWPEQPFFVWMKWSQLKKFYRECGK